MVADFFKRVCWAACASVVLLTQTGCFGSLRYVDRPVLKGHLESWVIEKSCMTESCSPEAWRLTDGDIRIDMMPRRGNKQDRYFSVWVTIWSDLDTRFTYAYEENFVKIAQEGWLKVKVPDTRNAGLRHRESMREFFRHVPAHTGMAEPRQLGSKYSNKFVDMTLFIDTVPPPLGVPFVIRFAGLQRNGTKVSVPDVEFRFRVE
jgi:hypothetical protein